eukprot:6678907-Alexandrium_andersonii.AAC.1
MSASLVGSEMCIRDSLRAADPNASAPHRAQRSPLAAAAVARGVEEECCLLYTSDAADDSSV